MNAALVRLVAKYGGTGQVMLGMSRCFSAESELQASSFKRKHATDKSFEEANKPYLSHPYSNTLAHPLLDISKDEHLSAAISALQLEIKNEIYNALPDLYRSSGFSRERTHDDVVFLTKDEWEAANESAQERFASITEDYRTLLKKRAHIEPRTTKDPGLEWAFESDITFVDCSRSSTNEDRYMVTRELDGTLYHNDHETRDAINGSFFPRMDQCYPPLDMFEDDTTFHECIQLQEIDLATILDLLDNSYSSDHPQFHKRHRQLLEVLLSQTTTRAKADIEGLLFSPHLVPLIVRALAENVDLTPLYQFIRGSGREGLANAIMALHLSNDPRSLKEGEDYRPKEVIIFNGTKLQLLSYEKKKLSTTKQLLEKASRILQLDTSLINSCTNLNEIDILVTVVYEETARTLHRQGAGRLYSVEREKFMVFANVVR